MANPFTGGFAPDLQSQQLQLSRQQQLADMLKQQAMQPMGGTDVVSGWAIQKSPWEGLAKLGQAYFGNQLQQQADEKSQALAQALQQRKMDAFDNMWGVQQPPQLQGRDIPTPLNLETGGGNIPEFTPQQTHPLYAKAQAALLAGNEDLANKLMLNAFEQTPEMKNMAYKGIDPRMMGMLEVGEMQNKATQAFDQGKSYRLPNGEWVNMPNSQGMIYDPVSRSSSVPQGFADLNAFLKGSEAGAVARAQAGNKLITVTPEGQPPRMMTEAQVIQQATGQSNPPLPAGTGFTGDLNKVRQQIMAMPDSADKRAALAQLDAQVATQKPGVALDTPEAAAGRLQRSKDFASAAKEFEDKGAEGRSMLSDLSTLQSALKDPNLYTGTGESLVNAGKNALVSIGVPVKGVASAEQAKAIINKLTLQSKSGMTGSMTDRDVQFLQNMVPQLGQSKEGQDKIIGYLQKAAERQVKVADMARAYEQKNGKIDNGFRDELKAYADKNPLFPAEQKAAAKPQAQQPKTFDTLPNPAQFSGKRMKAPDGSIIRSNGKQWVKE